MKKDRGVGRKEGKEGRRERGRIERRKGRREGGRKNCCVRKHTGNT
jgi:hypothetical protein